MEQAFAEMPLAIFTSLAPIAAGAFIALALVVFTTKLSDEQAQKLDKLSWIPLVVLVVGFVASFFHLTQLLNATHIFSGIVRSPLSNEILVGAIFFVIALVYCLLGTLGKLTSQSRKIFLALIGVAALVFSLFVGMAYMIETIVSWNTPIIPCAILGFCLFGGTLLCLMLLSLAGVLDTVRESSSKKILLALLIVGAVISIGAVCAHVSFVSGIETLVVSGAALVSESMVFCGIAIAGMVLALVGGCITLLKSNSFALTLGSTVVVIAAVLCARFMFYAVYISVGL